MRYGHVGLGLLILAGMGGCGTKTTTVDVSDNTSIPVTEEEVVETLEAAPTDAVVEAPPAEAAEVASIGSAKMKDDGTLVLQLRATGEGGIVGDAYITYEPDDPRYQETLDHLGGLEPGQEKPVPPWPEE
jgi:hypothetical protein